MFLLYLYKNLLFFLNLIQFCIIFYLMNNQSAVMEEALKCVEKLDYDKAKVILENSLKINECNVIKHYLSLQGSGVQFL